MKIKEIELKKISDYLWEIPPTGKMKVPGRIYSSGKMLEDLISNDEALTQVKNVAHLPGIQKFSLAMPDIHWGYGFPIGGVAATDLEEGVISPGGVGYDINCGVRLATTSLSVETIKKNVSKLIENLYKKIPSGIGAKGAIKKLSSKEIKNILTIGAKWAVKNGFGNAEELQLIEEQGNFEEADPAVVSEKAIERGREQVATLGSGNHFLEVDVVEKIFDERAARVFGLFPNQIVIQVHTGSRGLGYQICDDYLKIFFQKSYKYKIELPDKQLICAPIKSDEGKSYLTAMQCAANFAWNNRQVIMHLVKNLFLKTLGLSEADLNFKLLYDVSHNIAKIEEHKIGNEIRKVCVHRKGATRAFPAGHLLVPEVYRDVGQPVIIPGDMGRFSFVAVGLQKAMEETFGSSAHGAGRNLSRHKALKIGKGKNLIAELEKEGIKIQAKGFRTIAEEMPYAYKNVENVVAVLDNVGITKTVARLKPIGVIKG